MKNFTFRKSEIGGEVLTYMDQAKGLSAISPVTSFKTTWEIYTSALGSIEHLVMRAPNATIAATLDQVSWIMCERCAMLETPSAGATYEAEWSVETSGEAVLKVKMVDVATRSARQTGASEVCTAEA